MSVIGVDVGGTFTDFVVYDTRSERLAITKVPTARLNPSEAILAGLRQLVEDGLDPTTVEAFLHGTTTTTNALIEQQGASVALLITKGLKGIVQVQTRGTARSRGEPAQQSSLIDELNVFEISERAGHSGEEIVPCAEEDVRRAARSIAERGLEAVAISFLFSFANPAHEQTAKQILEEELPGRRVFCSSEILPRIREWPRTTATILNAYLEPVLVRYIEDLAEGLRSIGIVTKKTFLMESNGGVMPFSIARAGGRAIHTILSGPAAAVQAARRLAELSGYENLMTMDLGGTSCDVAFVQNGEALEVTDGQVCGHELHVPMLDIETVGAGGGTIASVDPSGQLRVGPRSAGSNPGPAAYGLGGAHATITDADTVLGYLNPDYFLGGSLRLDPDASARVIGEQVASPLNKSVEGAALAMVRINDAHMADAIRVVAARRGVTLRECRLVACGGAGPVHAAAVAKELGIKEVVVPPSPGVFAALGLLCTDIAQDYVQTDIAPLRNLTSDQISQNFKDLELRAEREFSQQGFSHGEIRFLREIDARYAGQGFEIRVPAVATSGVFDAGDLAARFHERHERIYGHRAEQESVELVSYRLRALVEMPKFGSMSQPASDDTTRTEDRREIWFPTGHYTAQVRRRVELPPDERILGPAVIEQADTTVVVPPGWAAISDPFGNLVISDRT